ncbi:MAG: hypothetical protein LCH63_18385 [Candidatus Melainabacteria bacterium]|nr:hypothetical protein [Candidatus Melainabacteria bacterium]OPZ86586.1 MAG: hypothetical protein BWY75_02116 [bacterium ADurb.Bin425]
MARDSKRENFDVSPEQEADINCLQELIKAPTRKDAILTAVRLALLLAAESKQGNQFYLGRPGCRDLRRLLMVGIETANLQKWTYLVEQAHPWKRQLFIKGRKLPAAAVWSGMLVNKLSREEAAENWALPVEAIDEILAYCENNRALLEMEATEDMLRLEQKGIDIEPKNACR